MDDFPSFMKQPANRIAARAHYTPGIEGYVFDGVEGSQMAIWCCPSAGRSAEHWHTYDEYLVVVQGQYTVTLNGQRVVVKAGEELLIPRGVVHAGESAAGTRLINAFGGRRAEREGEAAAGTAA